MLSCSRVAWRATARDEREREIGRLRQDKERLRRELEEAERERKRIEHERGAPAGGTRSARKGARSAREGAADSAARGEAARPAVLEDATMAPIVRPPRR